MLHLKKFAIVAAALGLTATAALARPAVSEADLNVRSGPGTEYGVVGVIQRGESVDAGPCSGSWCQVNFDGGSGWASASYLSFGGGTVGYAAPPAAVYDDPYDYDDGYYVAPGFSYGYYGPSYRHRFRHRHRHGGWDGRPGRWNRGGDGRQDGVIGRGPSREGPVLRGPRGGQDGNVGMRSGGGRQGFSAGSGGFRGGANVSGGGSSRGGGGSANVSGGGFRGGGGGGMARGGGGGGGRGGQDR